MTPALTPATRRIRAAIRRIEELDIKRAELIEERNAAFAAARDEGMRMRQIGEIAGLSTEAVAKVLRDPAEATAR